MKKNKINGYYHCVEVKKLFWDKLQKRKLELYVCAVPHTNVNSSHQKKNKKKENLACSLSIGVFMT